MYTRESFEQQRTRAKNTERLFGRLTAAVAVGLGLGQLAFIALVHGRLDKARATTFELTLFIPYMLVVAFLVWRMDRAVTAARPKCPSCRVPIKGEVAEGLALTTGKCSKCGAPLIT